MHPGLAAADDNLKIAIGQRGGWEQSVSELGQNKGFFKKHGLTVELLYTQGSAETLQSVISNSVDIGIGLGTHALLGAYLKGAPIRGVGASFTSARYMTAYREALDWMYADPAAIDAYAEWSKLPRPSPLARRNT